MTDITPLELALGRLFRVERQTLAGGLTRVRNNRAEAGDAALAEVYNELLCLVIEAEQSEAAYLQQVAQQVADSVVAVLDDPRQP